MMQFEGIIRLLPGLVIGITVHEAAHAWSAMLLGDKLAYSQGRVSINPFKHLSPLGTLALFVLGFGWGKPVMINIYNFKRPKLYYLLSSLAGPAANLLICVLCVLSFNFTPEEHSINDFIYSVYLINGILFILNMLPIPPLDGSKIWPCIIPGLKPLSSSKWNMVWTGILIVLLFSGAIDDILSKLLDILNTAMFYLIF